MKKFIFGVGFRILIGYFCFHGHGPTNANQASSAAKNVDQNIEPSPAHEMKLYAPLNHPNYIQLSKAGKSEKEVR